MRYLWSLLFLCACSAPPPAVPLQAVPSEGDIPFVRASSGGCELRMGADTGSALPIVLFPEAAHELGSPPRSDAPVQDCDAQVRTAEHGTPPPCYVVLTDHAPMDGLLGWPLLRQQVWHLDWGNHRHEFAAKLPQEVRETWESMPLEEEEEYAAPAPDGCGPCMLDTGAPNAVYLPEELWRQVSPLLQEQLQCYSGVCPAAGGAFIAECAEVETFRLGPLLLRNIVLCETFCPDRDVIIIGCGALEQTECWIDGPNNRLYYRPYTD